MKKKRKLMIFILILMLFFIGTSKIHAEDNSVIQFKDEVLYSQIVKQLGDKISGKDDTTRTIEMTKENINSVTSFTYDGKNREKISDLTGIGQFTNLHELALANNSIIDITEIANLKLLQGLSLSNNQIKDITRLRELTNLNYLYLGNNNIERIEKLSELKELIVLDLYNNNITSITALQGLTNLTQLYLQNNQIKDIMPLSKLTKLTKLQLNENNIESILALSGLTNLTQLNLEYNQITNIEKVLEKLTKLIDLRLYENNIEDIDALKGLTNLTTLTLGHNQIKDITPLSELKNLTYLGLNRNQITNIEALKNATNLKYLHLGGNKIKDISALAELTNLTTLGLNLNQIKDITAIAALTNLTTLNLSNNQIKDITALVEVKKLENLDLKNNVIYATNTSTTNEIALPRIIMAAKDRNSRIYTENDYTLSNCTLSSDTKKIIITDISKVASIRINGGKADGTELRYSPKNPTIVEGVQGLVFNNKKQNLVTTSNAIGDVYYSATTELTESNYKQEGKTEIPVGWGAYTFTVYYYAPGEGIFEDKYGNVKVTIAKMKNPIKVIAQKITYDGKGHKLVETSNAEGDVYYSATTELTASNYNVEGKTEIPVGFGAYTFTVHYYTPGNDNYKEASGSVEVTIEKPEELKEENPIEVVANKITYDGKAHKLLEVKNKLENCDVKYAFSLYGDGTSESPYTLTEIPEKTDAGTYTVHYYAKGNNNYKDKYGNVEVKIEKANNPIKVVANKLKYTGESQKLITTSKAQGDVYYLANKELTASNYTTEGKTEIPVGRGMYTWTIYYYTPGNDNYKEASGSVEVTIEKPEELKEENPIEIVAKNTVYNGEEHDLVEVKNNLGNCDVKYAFTLLGEEPSESPYTLEAPKKTDAGKYTVHYYVKGNNNYKDKYGNVEVTIEKANNPIEVVANKITYDGKAHKLVEVKNKLENCDVKYAIIYEGGPGDGSTYPFKEIPEMTDVGWYPVYYYAKGNNNYKDKQGKVEVTIEKVENPIEIEGKKNLGYDGKEQELVTVKNSAGDNYKGKIYYSLTEELNAQNKIEKGSTDIPKGKALKTYTVYYWAENYEIYAGKAGSVEVTIGKGKSIVTVTAKEGLVYDGTAKILVDYIAPDNQNTIYYSLEKELNSSNYKEGSTSRPQGTEAREYTVYWYAPETTHFMENHGMVKVTIEKAENPIEVIAKPSTYNGQAHPLVVVKNTLKDRVVYYSLTEELTVENKTKGSTTIPEGTVARTYTVYYYAESNDNYNGKSGKVEVTIEKANNPIEVVAKPGTYNGQAHALVEVKNNLENCTVKYAISWNDGGPQESEYTTEIPKRTDAGTYPVYYYVEGNDNYKDKRGAVEVTIEKGDNPTEIVAIPGTYNGQAHKLVEAKNTLKDRVVYYSLTEELTVENKTKGSTTIPEGTGAGTYTVYYYAESNDNYNGKSGKVEVTIGKAENPIEVVGNQLTYTGEAQELVRTSKAEGTVYYSARKEVTASNYNTGDPDIKTEIPKGTGTYTWTVYYYVEGNKNYNAKAGSVQATISPVESKLRVEIAEYGTKEKDNTTYITRVKPGTTIEELENKITTNGNIEIYDQGQKITNKKMNLKTGMKLIAKLGEEQKEYTIVVIGDVTGNGKIGLGDISKLQRYIVEIDKNLTGAYLEAADVNMDGKNGGQGDLVKMMRVLIELDRL